MGIENRFRFQNRILKFRNRILYSAYRFLCAFFSSSVRTGVTYRSVRTLLANLSAPKFGYICDQKPKKPSIISVIAKHVAREVSPPT